MAAHDRLPAPVPRFSPFALAVKRGIDIVGALVFFLIFLPVFVFVGVGVRMSSPGAALYRQSRVGKGGRRFGFYKFRSMLCDSEEVLSSFLDTDPRAREQWESHQKLEQDPRITRFGRFIRRSSLDELPQFWNVLVGDMSLVGPRPCMPEQEPRYGRYWSIYCAMRPGLTGLWQVSGRNHLSYNDRVRLDVQYAQHWSLWLDLKIISKTFWVVATGHGSQ
ncbi:sugar transferase [Caenimonas terrae]|uniref:Sugar transferase n=1 Tax=Caenimonas terrae TaxID=696074 RepID=A0ABW0NEN1_9BURK